MASEPEHLPGEVLVIREVVAALEDGLVAVQLRDLVPLEDCLEGADAQLHLVDYNEAPLLAETNDVPLTSPLLPTAAIAYCRTLLAGVVSLLEGEQGRLVGILLRSLYETWLVGLYCLVGGLDAAERLLKARDYRLIPLGRAFGLEQGPKVGPGRYLSVKELAQRVQRMLADQPRLGLFYSNPKQLYQTIYALDSYELVHGGIGALDRYLGDLAGKPHVILKPDDADLGLQKGTLATLLAIDLARPVWRLGGLSDQRLLDLDAALRRANRISYYGSSSPT